MGGDRALSPGGLVELLERRAPLFSEAAHRRWLLSLPPFRPGAEHPLAARATELLAAPVDVPGAVLLVGEHRGVGSLFWLSPDAAPERLIPFRGEAREQVELVRRLVPRALPALVDASALGASVTGARRAVLGCTDPGALDGPSFGLALGLAMASSLLEEPLPSSIAALARLDEQGRCRDVGHLFAKIDVVARWALGVTRLLVSAEQESDARRIVEELDVALEVVAARDLGQALRHAFGDVEETLRRRWIEEPVRASKAARGLLALARDGFHHLLDWRGVARAARGLVDQLEPGEERWMAELAEHIANRHRQAPTPLTLHDEWLAGQPRPFRLRLWAHLVQSAADGMNEWRPLLARAAEQLAAPGDEHLEDLVLAGALGRAHASFYEYEMATPLLARAARGFCDLEQPFGASYAISELLRVAGATGDAQLAARVESELLPILDSDPRTDRVALGFVHVAAGRCRVQLDRPREAAKLLGAVELPPEAPAHLSAARLRWLAEALRRLGGASPSERLHARLEREHADGDGLIVLLLARLDLASARGAPVDVLLTELRRERSLAREARRLEERFGASGDALAGLLRQHSRY